jgi:glutamate synthase (ferredoxin)
MLPNPQGLYHPENEHDNCGAGFICSLKGERTNDIIHKALDILVKLEHRGAVSADGKTGDGAGILIDIPHDLNSLIQKNMRLAWFSFPKK